MKAIFLRMFTAGLILLFAPSCRNPSPVGSVPPNFQLNQNFPNPFTDLTTVQYGVPANASGLFSRFPRRLDRGALILQLGTLEGR